MKRSYLGDGVYARYEDDKTWISTPTTNDQEIGLPKDAVDALIACDEALRTFATLSPATLRFDGWQVWIKAPEGPFHEIAVEPDVIYALKAFDKRMRATPDDEGRSGS